MVLRECRGVGVDYKPEFLSATWKVSRTEDRVTGEDAVIIGGTEIGGFNNQLSLRSRGTRTQREQGHLGRAVEPYRQPNGAQANIGIEGETVNPAQSPGILAGQ